MDNFKFHFHIVVGGVHDFRTKKDKQNIKLN